MSHTLNNLNGHANHIRHQYSWKMNHVVEFRCQVNGWIARLEHVVVVTNQCA